MGLFSIFSKNAEAYEKKGDTGCMNQAFGSAKIDYEKALEKLKDQGRTDDPLFQRIQEKLSRAVESLAGQHKDRAISFLESGNRDDALTYFSLAADLTRNNDVQKELERHIKELMALKSASALEEVYSGDHIPNERFEVGSDLDEFYALIGSLPDDLADEYAEYGDSFIQGFIKLNRGEFQDAVPLLEKALEDQGDRTTHIHMELATALIPSGEPERAEKLLDDFLSRYPESLNGTALMADLLWSQERFAEAHTLLDSLPEQAMVTTGFCLLKGKTLFLEQRFEEAGNVYREFLNSGRWDDAVARSLAETLASENRFTEARSVLTTLLNACTGCGRQPKLEDRLFFADLSINLEEAPPELIDGLLKGAMARPDLAGACFARVAKLFRMLGNEEEAIRYEALSETA